MTLDVRWLRRWLAPGWADEAAVGGLAARFAAHPARVVVLQDVLAPRVADRVARFLATEAEFDVGHGLLDRYGWVSKEDFDAAPKTAHFFRYGALARVRGAAAASPGFVAFRELTAGFSDPRAVALFAALSGMTLGPMTFSARAMGAGDFLVPHTDDVGDRLLSFVIYLTPGWEPRFGGALALKGRDGSTTRVEAAFNSMAVFDAETWHHVEPLNDAALRGRVRRTIGGWYMRPGGKASPGPG